MNIGGVEKSLLSLLSVLPREKYDITILLLEKNGGFLGEIPEEVNVVEAAWFPSIKPVIMQPPKKSIKNYLINTKYLKMFTFTYSYIISKYLNKRYLFYKEVFKAVPANEEEFDIAISYQGPTDIIDYYVANKVSAKKKITWVHFDVTKHHVNEKLYSTLYKKFNNVFVVSVAAKEKLIEKFPDIESKTEVFKNIISKKLVNELSKKDVDFDNSFTGLRIVTVGRLSSEKGHELAIEVAKKLKTKGYNIRWYCIGEGNCRELYEQLIEQYDLQDEFQLLGAKTNPYPYMAHADIYVQPSAHEGYCITLAEAKCLNKPIIATNFTGALEQIQNGYNGFIVNYCKNDLCDKLKYLIENPSIRKRLTKNLVNQDNNENPIQNLFKFTS
jgi:glycosyltransferase involved in cell wall biosynthesis